MISKAAARLLATFVFCSHLASQPVGGAPSPVRVPDSIASLFGRPRRGSMVEQEARSRAPAARIEAEEEARSRAHAARVEAERIARGNARYHDELYYRGSYMRPQPPRPNLVRAWVVHDPPGPAVVAGAGQPQGRINQPYQPPSAHEVSEHIRSEILKAGGHNLSPNEILSPDGHLHRLTIEGSEVQWERRKLGPLAFKTLADQVGGFEHP